MNLAIWDIESSSASTDFGSIIEIGGILFDENFKEKDRFNLRCRLHETEIFQAAALIVNKTSIKQLTQTNLSHYQMLGQVEKIFKKWSPAIFLGWSSLNFDEEMIRKEFFKSIRYPYLTNSAPNTRHDGINIARAAYAVDPTVLETEINEKNNPVFKLASLAQMQGIDASDAHSALADAELTAKVLKIVKKKQEHTWESFLSTSNKSNTETIMKKGEIVEYANNILTEDAKAQMKAAKKITDPALMTTGEALVSDLASLAVESNNDFFKKLVSGGIEMSGAVVKGLADLSDQGVSKILGETPFTQEDAKTADFYEKLFGVEGTPTFVELTQEKIDEITASLSPEAAEAIKKYNIDKDKPMPTKL